ncbi:hypothetical protein ACTVJH_03850 [Desulfoplanes sp. PS50]|jgi:hypothetical protein
MQPCNTPDKLIGSRILITGEVNTGKTTLTGLWADQIWNHLDMPCVAVMDMAPTIPPDLSRQTGTGAVGGHVMFNAFIPDLLFRGDIHPPRMLGGSPEHILALALENKKRIETWFADILAHDRVDLLVINDMSIYLQAGEIDNLAPVIHHAHTVIANGYMGKTLGTDTLSQTEQLAMNRIARIFQHQVRLTKILI